MNLTTRQLEASALSRPCPEHHLSAGVACPDGGHAWFVTNWLPISGLTGSGARLTLFLAAPKAFAHLTADCLQNRR